MRMRMSLEARGTQPLAHGPDLAYSAMKNYENPWWPTGLPRSAEIWQ